MTEKIYARVTDAPGYVRDLQNQAVLNSDSASLQAYKAKRGKQKELLGSINDINSMKQDINDLKMLMNRILEKIG
jgi:hypothetical protein